MPSARELLHIQLRTMFELDTLGRLSVGPRGGNQVPRIFVARAGSDSVKRVRQDIPERTARSWLGCQTDEELRRQVEAHEVVVREYRGPAYALPELRETGGEAIPLGPAAPPLHPELVARGWKVEETPPYFGIVRDGLVVSVCFSPASSEEAAEAGVQTVEAYRGRGLVVEAVRAWAKAVQESGRLALYSTTWENTASQRVAEKLGAFHYGEDWHLT